MHVPSLQVLSLQLVSPRMPKSMAAGMCRRPAAPHEPHAEYMMLVQACRYLWALILRGRTARAHQVCSTWHCMRPAWRHAHLAGHGHAPLVHALVLGSIQDDRHLSGASSTAAAARRSPLRECAPDTALLAPQQHLAVLLLLLLLLLRAGAIGPPRGCPSLPRLPADLVRVPVDVLDAPLVWPPGPPVVEGTPLRVAHGGPRSRLPLTHARPVHVGMIFMALACDSDLPNCEGPTLHTQRPWPAPTPCCQTCVSSGAAARDQQSLVHWHPVDPTNSRLSFASTHCTPPIPCWTCRQRPTLVCTTRGTK